MELFRVPDLKGHGSVEPFESMQLFIVRRGRESTFRLLERQFGADPTVRIIWDRRYRERRVGEDDAALERRRRERRIVPPTVWPSTNYLVVNVDD